MLEYVLQFGLFGQSEISKHLDARTALSIQRQICGCRCCTKALSPSNPRWSRYTLHTVASRTISWGLTSLCPGEVLLNSKQRQLIATQVCSIQQIRAEEIRTPVFGGLIP